MTPPLCYSKSPTTLARNVPVIMPLLIPIMPNTDIQNLVYPVMCDTSMCHSVPSMCWGDAGYYSSRPFQTFMQRSSHQLPLFPTPSLSVTLRGSVGIYHAVPGCVKVGYESFEGSGGCRAPLNEQRLSLL